MGEMRRDWANLPSELIHLVTSRLPDVADFIRFRAVCKGWRLSAPLSDPPPQLPWLLECHRGCPTERRLGKKLRFYSLSTGEIGALPVKQSYRGKSYHGPSSGHLILMSVQFWMWNPLTNADISIPPFHSHFVTSLWPVWAGSDPVLSCNFVFVEWDPDRDTYTECWAVYRPGSTEWNIREGCFNNTCYWDGMFFTTSGGRDTTVFDATSQKFLYEIPSSEDTGGLQPQSYLVEISGVLMRVCAYLEWDEDLEESVFYLYELHFEGRDRNPYWVKVSDIGDHILFLDLKNGFSMKSVAGIKGNCIYFFGPRRFHLGNTPCRYDIATDTFQRLPCPFEACTWFLPSLG